VSLSMFAKIIPDWKILAAVIPAVFLIIACSDEPTPSEKGRPAAILFLQDPLQEPCPEAKPFTKKIKNGSVVISPVAAYRIAGEVMSKRKYSSGWGAEVAPFDIALVWGMLTYPHVQKQLVIEHDSTRMAWFRIKGDDPPVEMEYAMSHGSNNHIIPANDNIYQAIEKKVKPHDKIVLEGYLVHVEGQSAEQPISLKTSLSRTDVDRGACEIIYVIRLQSGGRVYE
jgi:hypothetical protein